MANRTDPLGKCIHGRNPQILVEKIVRSKIYQSTYWKEHCFGLTVETLADKAMELDHTGGTYGGNRKPTPFLCLVLKMLQIQPDKDIVLEFIKNEDYKYVRVLGAFYLRLTGTVADVYQYLEPLYNDYRTIRRKISDGKFMLTYIDDFMDELLTKDYYCDIALPRLQRRPVLVASGTLEPRRSALEDDFDEEMEDNKAQEQHMEMHEPNDLEKNKGQKDPDRDMKHERHNRGRGHDNDKDYDKDYRHVNGRGRDRDRDCGRYRRDGMRHDVYSQSRHLSFSRSSSRDQREGYREDVVPWRKHGRDSACSRGCDEDGGPTDEPKSKKERKEQVEGNVQDPSYP